jgi:tRNA(Ile)-lysidine synthase TilS/MesJ
MKIGVAFSGGLDSTFVLMRALEEGHEVRPVYIDTEIGENMKILEKQQVERIYDRLHFRYSNLGHYTTFNLRLSVSHGFSLQEPPLWVYATMNHALEFGLEEVRIGYVLGDQANSYLDDIRKLWDALLGFVSEDHIKPRIVFPAVKWSKSDIIKWIKERNYDVWEMVTWCENPIEIDNKFKTCGECHSCKVMQEWSGDCNREYDKPVNEVLSFIKGDKNEKIKARLRGSDEIVPELPLKTSKAKRSHSSRNKKTSKRGKLNEGFECLEVATNLS